MQNIKLFNVCEVLSVKPKGLLRNIKKAIFLHHPVQTENLNFNSYIYILYAMQSYPKSASYLYEMVCFYL